MSNRFAFNLIIALLLALAIKPVFAIEIALIGDLSKRSVLQKIVQEQKLKSSQAADLTRASSADLSTTFTVTTSKDNPIAIANQLNTADVAFLVVDATQGPMPIGREQLIVARQARIPGIVIYFANVRALQAAGPKDAAELLELEEMEMRELLNNYEMGGDNAAVLFDADVRPIVKSRFPKGSSEIPRFLASYSPRRPAPAALQPMAEFKCQFYLLSNPETNGKGVTLKDKSEIEIWLEGRPGKAIVQSATSHKPGDVGSFVLRLATPLKGVNGSRLLLLKNGSAVGLGVVEKIVR